MAPQDLQLNRPIPVYRFSRRALTLCLQLCMGIQPESPDTRLPARSADALPATLYGHFIQAIYRNRPIKPVERTGGGESDRRVGLNRMGKVTPDINSKPISNPKPRTDRVVWAK
jgi:hypothetical protein